jgi:hypothetical protein
MFTRLRLLVGLTLPWLAGCAVAEYEEKMKEAQEQLRRYEEEQSLLEPMPLQPPTRPDPQTQSPIPVVDFHLRVPRGIGTQAPTAPRLEIFYDYQPTKPGAAGPLLAVSVAFAPRHDGQFANQVMGRFPSTGPGKQSTGRTRLGVDYRRIDGESDTYSAVLILSQGTTNQFALVYLVAKGQLPRVARAIELSLDSFGFDASLTPARQAFRPGGPLEYVPQ